MGFIDLKEQMGQERACREAENKAFNVLKDQFGQERACRVAENKAYNDDREQMRQRLELMERERRTESETLKARLAFLEEEVAKVLQGTDVCEVDDEWV